MTRTGNELLPRWSPRIVSWFRWYCKRYYFPPHFRALRLLHPVEIIDLNPPGPLVVVANHPSWWDPIICALLTYRYPDRRIFAPIDAKALKTYRFFKNMGFFGVEQGTARGAATFLKLADKVLQEPDTILWITAQGKFTDPRQRPVRLMPGLGRVLARLKSPATVFPLAMEYPFWDEKLPEALAHFGRPIPVSIETIRGEPEWTDLLSNRLELTMDELAIAAHKRDEHLFETLQMGKAGVGGMYDRIRRLTSGTVMRKFDGSHAAALGKTKEQPNP